MGDDSETHLRDDRFAARAFLLVDGAHAAARHRDEGACVRARLQHGLDASQQVVRLEDEQHLTRHAVQDVRDLGDVSGRLRLDYDLLEAVET